MPAGWMTGLSGSGSVSYMSTWLSKWAPASGVLTGTSHVNGQGAIPVDDIARHTGAFQGRGVTRIGAALNAGFQG